VLKNSTWKSNKHN